VPLTHANLTASAANIAASLALSPADRCLNVMPLFHIHGLVGCLLASLHAGGSVACTPGFDAFKFFGALEAFRPTWYSAVPTMHQAILSRTRGGEAPRHQLRFARSASSALPAVVASGIESLFGVPLIEAYGMTEASHQIASNPLPPQARKLGSVGLPSGVEVRTFADDGAPLSNGARGEVGIRGPSVTSGYEGIDPSLVTFPGGWLRTGDEGEIDADGYVWLTARIKEIINRGGEKVSPAEVESVLLEHPAVGAAVVFAVPHDALGQDVAAAVVPAGDAPPPEPAELRTFAADRLARFKVPRKILVVDAIPLGPTGKPQRTTMAARLGLE
jgi:acyl-CoA synthetase (AMP-forming)/AMP-acid ligase II